MLQTIRHYAPATTSAISNWWYGKTEDQKDHHHRQNTDQTSLLPCVPEERFDGEIANHGACAESKFTVDTLEINEKERAGILSDDEYRTGNEFADSSRRNTTEGVNFDSISQFPLSSDDEYKTCSEQQNGLLSSQHKLDDHIRQIILEGLSETNDEDDELPSRRKYTRSYLHSNQKRSDNNRALMSRSAPTGVEEQRNQVRVRNVKRIYEHTDSDSSCFDTGSERKKQNRLSFPLALFHSKKKKYSHRRRSYTTCASAKNDENALIFRGKQKSYGSDALIMNSNENQMKTLHNKHQRDAGLSLNEERDYPIISLSPEHQSASYLSSYHSSRRSLSESSTQASICSLDSSWSEYTISLPSADEAHECRESDLEESTCEMLPNNNEKTDRKVKRPDYLSGDLVKESFIDNECFCFQCSIM